ncbi:hypothetical protein FBQ82_18640 [Anaerolineae bacterium CFX7]|nr:hypothetical protein [Anaerolineae bacterium CFX7]
MITTLSLFGCGASNVQPAATRPAPPALDAAPTVANTLAPQAATSSPTAAPPSNSQNTPKDTPPDVIRRALLAQLQTPRERVLTKITGADGTTTEMLLEFIAPASLHVRSEAMELIAVEGKGTWMKNGDAWEQAPQTLAQAFIDVRDPEKIQDMLGFIATTRSSKVSARAAVI